MIEILNCGSAIRNASSAKQTGYDLAMAVCRLRVVEPFDLYQCNSCAGFEAYTQSQRWCRRDAMIDVDFWRDQAEKFRDAAEGITEPAVSDELLELAAICERVASEIEDHAPAG